MRNVRVWVVVGALLAINGCGVIGGGGGGNIDCDADVTSRLRSNSGESTEKQTEIRERFLDTCEGGAAKFEDACEELRADATTLEGPIDGFCPT